ncbi:iron complex transport system permease protein [Marininema mesophilum]|uniref:Iron complex transport system permease protein n=1 Tax=Marininema mesophilum TaxID=1048340 RepID=A0A1H2Z018_9BACL|nr:iron ABC transporter permease [Marininema mesophilum]SDX10691.1 iron complex transport system permease protein [Marininema mesophilum]
MGWSALWLLLLIVSMATSVSVGSAEVRFGDVWQVIAAHFLGRSGALDPATDAIIWQLRLPRVLLGALVGAALAGAGAVFQGLLKNPLADPFILGVSSGSALGAAIAVFTGWGVIWLGGWTVPVWAFLFGCLALLFVLQLSRLGGQLRTDTLILSGVVVQAFFGAMLTFVIAMASPVEIQRIQYWLMGSIALREWSEAIVIAPFLILGMITVWLMSRSLNLFALGERSAGHLGISVQRTRLTLLVVATLMTAAAVSVSGTIGFVGFIIPHIIRMLTGPDHRVLLPVSALAGAVFLVWADTLARTVLDPRELPIGVITALIGGPFFAWQLRRYTQGRQG